MGLHKPKISKKGSRLYPVPCICPIIYGAVTGAVAYGGYQLTQALNENKVPWTYIPSTPVLSDFLYQSNYSYDYTLWKNSNVYAPDRPLPHTENGVPIPDTDAPHTQLGTKGSKRRPGEKYPQAREFDNNGKPVKGIDFTDHGEPGIHPNPHEHPYETNPTEGTPQRGDPKPLENWKY